MTPEKATFRIWRGDDKGGAFQDYTTGVVEGMVVLDAVHSIQAEQANDLAVRWNCKAGKCGSCSAEINGMPRLMCMTRLSELPLDGYRLVEPMRSFPLLREESRGAHFREDKPAKDPAWGKVNLVLKKGPDGRMGIEKRAVPALTDEQKKIIEEIK